jgi:glutamate racemase
LLKPLLSRVMGPDVTLIDSAAETARAVRQELERRGWLAPSGSRPAHHFVVSDDEALFRRVGARFLGEQLQDVELAPL